MPTGPAGKIFDVRLGDVLASAATTPFDPQKDSTSIGATGARSGTVPKTRFDTYLSDVDSSGKPVP
jgi:hypothetical protein